jgi:RNA polymerase sigma factor (sigma-70 family)
LPTDDGDVALLLDALNSDDAQAAWTAFLATYSETIYGVIRTFTQNTDYAGDCFLFVCEKLADKGYRRLRAFRPDGRARFSTWLRAVTRNLCLDWHRSQFGRPQIFRFMAARSALDQEIFRAAFQQGTSVHDIWHGLSQKGRNFSFSEVERRVDELRNLMSARQLWLLTTTRVAVESLDSDREVSPALEVTDPSPDPESVAILRETQTALARAFSRIDANDRLLLRLRYLEGLGLLQVARLVGLKDAQTADRRIREALDHLREKLGSKTLVLGKRKSASV